MKNKLFLLCATWLGLYSIHPNVTAQTFDSLYVDGNLYAKLKDTVTVPFNLQSSPLNALVPVYGLDSLYWPFRGYNQSLDQIYRLVFTEIQLTTALISALETIPEIEYVEQVPLYKNEALLPNDFHPNQWHLTKINAEAVWNISQGSGQVVIAIVDNGALLNHEDLASNIWVNPGEIPNNGLDDDLNGFRDDIHGFDVADNDNNPNPPPGINNNSGFVHGTHCAGIASAVTNNGKGIASIGFNVKIMAVKCTRNNGDERILSHAYEGVFYAMRAGADIISMSFGGEGFSVTGQSIINAAHNTGKVLIAAAGNENVNIQFFPAAFPNVIAVGATDFNDQKASFSNFGTWIDLMAPGVAIFSTLAGSVNSYGNSSGTSMACPLVAGLAGLILSERPNFTPAQVKQALMNGCDNISLLNPGFSGQIGVGRINAFKTLSLISGTSSPEINSSFDVYPNPFHDEVRIFTNEIKQRDLTIEVFDRMGKSVFYAKKNMTQNEIQLSLRDLSSGIYFLQMKNKTFFQVKKIVKN